MKKRILNIGCGNEMYGTDRIDFIKTESTTKIVDLEGNLPYEDFFFDEIYCNSVLEHIRNLKILISECFRVLKQGGKIWFRTDSASYIPFHLRNHQDYILYNYASKDDKHYFLFKEEHLRNLFCIFDELKVNFSCPSKKLFFLPSKFKCMHIEITGIKGVKK